MIKRAGSDKILLAYFLGYYSILFFWGVSAKNLRLYPQLPDQVNACEGREENGSLVNTGLSFLFNQIFTTFFKTHTHLHEKQTIAGTKIVSCR